MTNKCQITTFLFLFCLTMGQLCSATPMLPEKDPEVTGEPVKLRADIAGKHPRLLLTAERLPQLREYNSEDAALYRQLILRNLASCVPPQDRKMIPTFGRANAIGPYLERFNKNYSHMRRTNREHLWL